MTTVKFLKHPTVTVQTNVKLQQNTSIYRERSDSVVECLTRDRGAAISNLTSITALCP